MLSYKTIGQSRCSRGWGSPIVAVEMAMMSNDPLPALTPPIAGDDAFRESIRELLRLAVNHLDVKFAIARLDGDEEIANDSGAPIDHEAALAEAVGEGDAPLVAQVRPSA